MPTLIFNEGIIGAEEKKPEISTEEILRLSNSSRSIHENLKGYNPSARRLMWFGVIGLAGVIFFLWTWSISLQWSSINWRGSQENNFIEESKNNFIKAFSGTPSSTEELKQDIKQNLQKIFLQMSSTTASSTINSTTYENS